MTTKDDSPITAIPTVYRGILLKSRLEAQCAFLFDKLGWKWQYEPQSIMLPNGVSFTPDFLIPSRRLIVECRGYDTEKGGLQISGLASMLEAGVEFKDTGPYDNIIQHFLVIYGNKEAVFFEGIKRTGMALILYCRECGWYIPHLSNVSHMDMELFEAFCPSCIAPLTSPSWGRWDGRARINAAAILTVSGGKVLVNGLGSDSWDWISDIRTTEEKEQE